MAYFTTDTDLIEYEPDILKYGKQDFDQDAAISSGLLDLDDKWLSGLYQTGDTPAVNIAGGVDIFPGLTASGNFTKFLDDDSTKSRLNLDYEKGPFWAGATQQLESGDTDWGLGFNYPLKKWYEDPENPESKQIGNINIGGIYSPDKTGIGIEGKWTFGKGEKPKPSFQTYDPNLAYQKAKRIFNAKGGLAKILGV